MVLGNEAVKGNPRAIEQSPAPCYDSLPLEDYKGGLESWLSGQQHLLFLEKTWVQSLEATWWLTNIWTSSYKASNTSDHRTGMHAKHFYIHEIINY